MISDTKLIPKFLKHINSDVFFSHKYAFYETTKIAKNPYNRFPLVALICKKPHKYAVLFCSDTKLIPKIEIFCILILKLVSIHFLAYFFCKLLFFCLYVIFCCRRRTTMSEHFLYKVNRNAIRSHFRCD